MVGCFSRRCWIRAAFIQGEMTSSQLLQQFSADCLLFRRNHQSVLDVLHIRVCFLGIVFDNSMLALWRLDALFLVFRARF